jgi:hypothetical protein
MLDVLGSWYFVNLSLIPVLWNLKGRAIYARPAGEIVQVIIYEGVRGGEVVKALRYKPAGRGFDSRWCHWNFLMP